MKTIRRLLLFLLVASLLSFAQSDQSNNLYKVSIMANSVWVGDLDLDGDNDILIGHNTMWQFYNPTISILHNINAGFFEIFDTSKTFCGYQENIIAMKVNADSFPDIIALSSDFSTGTPKRFVRVYYNDEGSFQNYSEYLLITDEVIDCINFSDIDGDGFNDVLFASNWGQVWGIVYNDGNGGFSPPEYFPSNYAPMNITAGDLNNDGRNDIIVCGGLEIYSNEIGGFEKITIDSIAPNRNALIVDFDLDGDNDIAAYDSYFHNSVITFYENIGDTFSFNTHQFFYPRVFSNFLYSDFNNDSIPDIAFITPVPASYDTIIPVPDSIGGIYLFYGNSSFVLSSPEYIPLLNLKDERRNFYSSDVDHNGYNDLIVVRKDPKRLPWNLEILYNDGQGNFLNHPLAIRTNESLLPKIKIRCYPNPFSEKIFIKIYLEEKSNIKIGLYDLSDKEILSTGLIHYLPGMKPVVLEMNKQNRSCIEPGIYLINVIIDSRVSYSFKVIKI